MGKAGQPGEKMSRVERVRPEINFQESRWVRGAFEEVVDAVVRNITSRADVWSLLVNNGTIRTQGATKSRTELGEGGSPMAR